MHYRQGLRKKSYIRFLFFYESLNPHSISCHEARISPLKWAPSSREWGALLFWSDIVWSQGCRWKHFLAPFNLTASPVKSTRETQNPHLIKDPPIYYVYHYNPSFNLRGVQCICLCRNWIINSTRSEGAVAKKKTQYEVTFPFAGIISKVNTRRIYCSFNEFPLTKPLVRHKANLLPNFLQSSSIIMEPQSYYSRVLNFVCVKVWIWMSVCVDFPLSAISVVRCLPNTNRKKIDL